MADGCIADFQPFPISGKKGVQIGSGSPDRLEEDPELVHHVRQRMSANP